MESFQHPTTDQNSSDALLEPVATLPGSVSKEEHQRLFQRGLKWLCGGTALMGLSFGINFLLFHSDQSFITAMYVLTSVGAVCLMKGLADILGF